MCGIVGYLGKREAAPVLLEGLKRLEYRGYDSAGICVYSPNGKLSLVREVGKISRLEERLKSSSIHGVLGIGHSRWATHGRPSEENAHPHTDCKGDVVLVHNGIIENYMELKKDLLRRGHQFRSETDTEVICHLFEVELKAKRINPTSSNQQILSVILRVVGRIRGAYSIVAVSKCWGDVLVGIRKDCPLVVGVADKESFLASDVPALLPFTKKVVFLNEGEITIIRENSLVIYSSRGKPIQRAAQFVPWDPLMAERGNFKHFMHKEIHEGPRSFEDTLRTRVYEENLPMLLEEAALTPQKVKQIKSVQFLACGTAYHAALVGSYLFESWAGLATRCEIASEFRYAGRRLQPGTLTMAISQSGETADTLAALRLARSWREISTVGIVNQIGSTLTREVAGTLYTRCGPEIGVASTKAFIAQLACLYLLALGLGRARGVLEPVRYKKLTDGLMEVPNLLREVINHLEKPIEEYAQEFQQAKGFIYLGRHVLYPIALESALKLKEISYIHAEGYAAGELKHGPIALIDAEMPVFAFAPLRSSVYDKTRSNLEEVRARGAKIIAVGTQGDKALRQLAYKFLPLPKVASEFFEPVLAAVCGQLFAYHVARLKGLDVDQPRNLAKSVTVE